MKYITIIILSIVFSLSLFGQEEVRDSLRNELRKYDKTDTLYIDILQDIAVTYKDSAQEKMLELVKEAEQLSSEIGYESGVVGSKIFYSYYYRKHNRFDTALTILRSARKSALKLDNQPLAFRLYENLGELCIVYDQYDTLNLYLEEYLTHFSDKGKRDLQYIYQKLAVSNYYLAQLNRAVEYAQKGIKISKSYNNLESEANLANIIASSLKRKGELDTAIHYFNRIVEIAKELNDKRQLLIAYNNLANIYGDRGNNPKALDYYLLTLQVADETGYKGAKAVIYNNIAIVYYTLKDYPETIKYLKKSLKIAREMNSRSNIANALNNIGELYLKQDSLQKSLSYYNEAKPIIKKIKDKLLLVDCFRGKAEVFSKLNVNDSARIYYLRALKLAEEAGADESLAKTYLGLSRFYADEGQYQKSSGFSQKALKIANDLGQVDIIRESAAVLHETSAKLHRYKNAYKYLSLYTKMNDSLLSADNTKEVTQLQMQYQYDKEKQQRETRERVIELKRQRAMAKERNIRNTFIGAFIFVLLIVVLAVRHSRQKHRANQQLSLQKAEIEEKNEEMHQLMSEVSRQKDEIESSHNKITDSIRYARRIQTALFPLSDYIQEHISDHFVLYEPLEIVSGDFYWFEKVHNHILLAVADCTGHGVPGAMMSMLGISYLNEMARQPHITEPNQVLEGLRRKVKRSLHQTGDVRESRDGMDIAFVDINLDTSTLTFSGANNPLILIRDGKMTEFKPDRQPISVYHDEKPFTNKQISLQKNDVFYLFSDGFRDQFQGDTGKKYGKKHFRELLLALHDKTMQKQKYLMQRELYDWMQHKTNQLDDILVAGFRW